VENIMKIISEKHIIMRRPHAMTIGKFDGLHPGHIALIKKTIDYAKNMNMPSMVFTFQPNPISVLSGKQFEPLLNERQKIDILSDLGVDILVNYPFNKAFANISPDEFMKLIFVDLKCHALIVGEYFRFGKDRKGEASTLINAGKKYGAIVDIVKNVEMDNEPISSSRIRDTIDNGNKALTERLLGRPLEW
jgi:riboflavin kinase/FMN adenylyltransferase